ncbi:MAG: DUF21 domain-containing protein [Acidimicrobiales bacterium]|nr:DUF21 domain-containing protein [Acidimicrobiales bacterium]
MQLPLLTILLIACFAGIAVLAVAEVSIIRVRRSAVVSATASDPRRASQLLALLDDLPIVLNSILFFVLLLQITSATVGAYVASELFGGVAIPIASFGLTLILFVYAEAIPKTLAVRDPHKMALRVTPFVQILSAVTRPIVASLLRLADLQSPGEGATLGVFTQEEIISAAHEAAEVGQIDRDDAELVARSFEFNDREVDEVMVPRRSIVHIEADAPIEQALATAIAAGHRRLPVIDGDIDQIVGAVRLRDLAAPDPGHGVRDLTTPVLTCSPSTALSDLLGRMQTSGTFFAIVRSDTGQTAGLVTIEDVVAELVGEITVDEPPGAGPGT